jgi:N-acetylglucosamine-6-sulfatase
MRKLRVVLAVALGLALVTAVAVRWAGHVPSSSARPRPVQHSSSPPLPRRPNIVLIVTDDQRWDTIRSMPSVERLLGSGGITFTNAFVTTSLCCPSRASILTGQYSRHTGVYGGTDPKHGDARAFRDGSTLATWLHDAGYETALVGKYLNGYSFLPRGYIPPGWDDWIAVNQRKEFLYYEYTLNQNGHLVRFGERPRDYSTTVLTKRALAFLRSAAETHSPFFLYFAPIAPHLPALPAPADTSYKAPLFSPPPSFNEPRLSDKPWAAEFPRMSTHQRQDVHYYRRRQLASLLAVDRSVAEIVATLSATQRLSDTVIVFTSDNGFLWGEHRLVGKIWPYEESIRVPLVVWAPWIQTQARADPHLVLNIDLAPTLAQLAGAQPTLPEDGRSLVPLLLDRGPPWRTSFIVEYLGPFEPGLPHPFEAIRTSRYLYVEYRARPWRELYDLRADPFELRNRAGIGSYSSVQADLILQLHRLLR